MIMDYIEIIKATQKELDDHSKEWVEQYESYIRDTLTHIDSICDRRKQFHKWANLSVYYTIGRAKSNSPFFDLRYLGQSVGSIHCKRNGVFLHISKDQYANNCNPDFFVGYPTICKAGEYDWKKDEVAKAFRAYFQTRPEKKKHPEHRYENLLLNEFFKKTSKDKSLLGIQPITIGKNTDLFFQMPTPLTASKNFIKFSKGHGGIDILARHNRVLTVIELKDEYQNPDEVIRQAIAYATFIVELCKTRAKSDFWKLCGFSNDSQMIINVVCMLPASVDKAEPSFAKKIVVVPNSDFQLCLHYIYFDKEAKITKTSL